MSKRLKPLNKTSQEATQEELESYVGNKPVANDNKSYDLSVNSNDLPQINIGLEDIDNTIMYYFKEVIKPQVIQNNTNIDVPIMYGSPEKWSTSQKQGFLKDKGGKIMLPLIMFRKSNIEKNRELGNKLDGNKVHLYHIVKQKYNRRNVYDNFTLLNDEIPEETFNLITVPDYITITYDCIINTEYNEQINKIIEAINFASDSYWGIPNQFQFRTRIDSYSLPIEISNDGDRIVTSNFSLILNGYIIPDSRNADKASLKGFNSKTNLIFTTEIEI